MYIYIHIRMYRGLKARYPWRFGFGMLRTKEIKVLCTCTSHSFPNAPLPECTLCRPMGALALFRVHLFITGYRGL